MLERIKRKGQEEMVGFAIIIIIVAVILLVFLSFLLRDNESENVQNYELSSFIQSSLYYTTDCADSYEPRYRSLERLIIDCNRNEKCLDERDTCEVLESVLKGIIEESWKIEGDRPVKGYDMKITSEEQMILELKEGNETKNYKTSLQELGKEDIQIILNVYY